MMIGLVGSGKSTVAREMSEDVENVKYISSDELRTEMFGDVNNQDKNAEVFEEMRKRTLKYLSDGFDVVYDATNLSMKRRKHLLSYIKKDIKKIALYMSTPYDICVKQDLNRKRIVGENVISNMYKSLQTPIYSEGWDNIVHLYHDSVEMDELPVQFTESIRVSAMTGNDEYELMNFLAEFFDEFKNIHELAQDSKYHAFSVSRHIYHVYKDILSREFETQRDKEIMVWTALLHDIGKYHCKKFTNFKGEKTKYANFIGHENVGAQLAINFMKKMNFSDAYIYEISTLIQFHMYLLNEKSSKKKLIDRVGQRTYDLLEILRDADTKSH